MQKIGQFRRIVGRNQRVCVKNQYHVAIRYGKLRFARGGLLDRNAVGRSQFSEMVAKKPDIAVEVGRFVGNMGKVGIALALERAYFCFEKIPEAIVFVEEWILRVRTSRLGFWSRSPMLSALPVAKRGFSVSAVHKKPIAVVRNIVLFCKLFKPICNTIIEVCKESGFVPSFYLALVATV